MFLKLYKTPLFYIVFSILLYWVFAYNLIRTDYAKLVAVYAVLFFVFYNLLHILKHNIIALSYLAFGFRAVFILAIPNLSQDFYRFIWDGRLILEGLNPYLFTVEWFISNATFPVAQAQELYNGMGLLNASHYTNYPPINQLCFLIAAFFSSNSILGSVIGLRLIIILADFGTLYFGKKLLSKLNLPTYHIFWYILNPFIIIELTGNLHFEGVMIFFLVWSLYLLHIGKWYFSAIVLGLSISVKLIPLIFMPLFFKWFVNHNRVSQVKNEPILIGTTSLHISKSGISITYNVLKLLLFYVLVGVTILLLFLPFYTTEFINNYTHTTALWFNSFEFNASLYYIAREIGYGFRGQNEIAIIGTFIPKLVLLFVLLIAFFKKNTTTIELITSMLFVLSFYYFTATTVHPWYVATLLILTVFTKYRFALVWSFVIILSYLAYLHVGKEPMHENLLIITFEYAIVYSYFIWEVCIKKAPNVRA